MITPVAAAGRPALARRAVLASGATLGAGLAASGTLLPAAAAADRTPAAAGNPVVLFTDPALNFQSQFTVGAAGYGAAEYGEAATAFNSAHHGGDTYDAYYDAFRSMGQVVGGFGHQALAGGNHSAARGAFLRAASYLANPLYVAIGTRHPRRSQAAAYRAMNDSWVLAAGLLEPAAERVAIPYGRTSMPGWLLRPPGRRTRRPTVILNNGNDAQNIGLYVYGAVEAVAQGYNALIFEGPGQGSMLFLRGIPFRPDWEAVITPIVDYLQGRPDVDPDRIALIGWSQGGALCARAAAFEHRLAALVLDPGVSSFMSAFHLPKKLVALALSGHDAEANAIWTKKIFPKLPISTQFLFTKSSYPFLQPTFAALIQALAKYETATYLPKITTPTLVDQYVGDASFAGQGEQVMKLLRCPKTLHTFTPAAGCQFHCAPMAPQRRNQVIFDWLRKIL